MLKKISVTLLAASTVVITATPINAQSYKNQRYFLSDFFDKPPNCTMFYPEPVGKLPGLMNVHKICLPPPIAIIPKYGRHYERLMRIAINAGIRGDYDTALFNFRRAHLIEISREYLGYSNREALRGINGALVAKRYQSNPHSSNTRMTPQYFWYYWTGTGDRRNWGRSLQQ
jgi:hypothetical protein